MIKMDSLPGEERTVNCPEKNNMTNEQLINLCEYQLNHVRELEAGHYWYTEKDWKDLKDAINELQKRAGMNEDLDEYNLSDFAYLIEKATLMITKK